MLENLHNNFTHLRWYVMKKCFDANSHRLMLIDKGIFTQEYLLSISKNIRLLPNLRRRGFRWICNPNLNSSPLTVQRLYLELSRISDKRTDMTTHFFLKYFTCFKGDNCKWNLQPWTVQQVYPSLAHPTHLYYFK